jgi:hypothetical protein
MHFTDFHVPSWHEFPSLCFWDEKKFDRWRRHEKQSVTLFSALDRCRRGGGGEKVSTRVARWYIFKPKIRIWVNFGRSCNGRCWVFLGPSCLLHGQMVYFRAFWYSFVRFGILYREKSGNPGPNLLSDLQICQKISHGALPVNPARKKESKISSQNIYLTQPYKAFVVNILIDSQA